MLLKRRQPLGDVLGAPVVRHDVLGMNLLRRLRKAYGGAPVVISSRKVALGKHPGMGEVAGYLRALRRNFVLKIGSPTLADRIM